MSVRNTPAMTIKFYCPSGHRLKAPAQKAGLEMACPVCHQRSIVPRPAVVALPSGESVSVDPDWLHDTCQDDIAALPPREARLETKRRPPPLPLPAETEPAPPRAYRADSGSVRSVRWLAAVLTLFVAFSLGPAVANFDLAGPPGWAWAVLLVGLLQLFYVFWMVATPDWSSEWVLMVVFSVVAALYGAATAMTLAAPADKALPWGLSEFRTTAPAWCGAVLAVMALGVYLCGYAATKWRHAWQRRVAVLRRSGCA